MNILKNEFLTVKTKSLGAELTSIITNKTGREYLWQGDPAFWKRQSPVLFPIVGSLWNGEYQNNDITYRMSQHGFARDKEFTLQNYTSDEIFYSLRSNDETLAVYPFPFELQIGYKLEENRLRVIWKVINIGDSDMYFQIGAHPAFFYIDFNNSIGDRGYFSFDKTDNLRYILIKDKGCVDPNIEYPLNLEDGLLPINTHTFDKDALILENDQVKKVSLLDRQKKPYITLYFDAPLVGLWAPKGEGSPFVCIEPWYGRCDRYGYVGEYKDRDWMNSLKKGERFEASYDIEIN